MVDTTHAVPTSAWSGGTCPFDAGWRKVMMWFFIVADGLLFAGFLASYGFARLASPNWPPQDEIFHLGFIAAMTFVLISSSATMASAVTAARASDGKAVQRFVWLTVLGGVIFLGMQVVEWTNLIQEGVRLGTNPWGAGLFGAYFFVITGFHGTHVLSGVILLAIVANGSRAGRATPGGVELAGLYWHFIDLVWIFIFTVFYLL